MVWKKWKVQRPVPHYRITIFSDRELVMENVSKILFCDEERIVLEGKVTLEVTGKGLRLKELGNENMAVCGRIEKIAFERKKP